MFVFILWSYLLYLCSLRSLSRSPVQGCGLHASYNSSHLFIVCFSLLSFSRRLQRSQAMTQFIQFGLVRVFVVFLFLLSFAETHPNMTFWMATMWTRDLFFACLLLAFLFITPITPTLFLRGFIHFSLFSRFFTSVV